MSGNNYGISYTYEPGGALRSITPSTQLSGQSAVTQEIDYENDIAGRVVVAKGGTYGPHSNGAYANNIKYRAFGQLKEIDYKVSSTDTSAIKMSYDNALRVSHFETTVPGSTTSWVQKADYTYNADGRTASKDDNLNDKWDRTMKYDFAGRMTKSVFGDPNTSGQSPYQETVTYDGFSQMDQRIGKYWGQDITTDSGIGVNGRLEDGTVTYDAAGDLTYYQKTDELHNHNSAVFDAAGRRVSASDYFRDSSSIVTKHIDDYVFDGEGRPIIEKIGTAVGTVSSPPSDPTAATNAYQIWSSVLGKTLITLDSSGNKKDVNVYAGGMQIAVQTTDGSGDAVRWPISDPVTGTLAHLGSSSAISEEREPMGQLIALTDPGVPPPPATVPDHGSAADPEWQCIVEQTKAGFKNTQPCFQDLGFGVSQKNIPQSSPGEVHSMGVDAPSGSPMNVFLAKGLKYTEKDQGGDSGPCIPSEFRVCINEPKERGSLGSDLPTDLRRMGPSGEQPEHRPATPGSESMSDHCRLMVGRLREIMAQTLNANGPIKDDGDVNQFANGVANAFRDFFVKGLTSSSMKAETAGGIYSGDVGFKEKFQDTPNGKRSYEDQTHHFAEYFYTGYYATESWKAYLHSMTDVVGDNKGDLNLGAAAFEMGLSMRSQVTGSKSRMNRNNPRLPFPETVPIYENYRDRLNRIYAISDRVLNEICD